MSQQEIDRFYQYLREHPEDMKKARKMKVNAVVAFAASLGFHFEQDDLKARQALVHMIEGT